MPDEYTYAEESLKNLTGDDLLREIGRQIISVRRKLGETYQLMFEMNIKLKNEKK
ncbi:MAG: hypothetical protein KAW52_08690 [candidate division Zixibacteria bacterium]|nr:hypothetical protein [candidate division Zixibacteria bacterium]